MEEGYRIWIDRSSNHFGINIRIGLVRGGQNLVAEPIRLVFKPHKHGQLIPPTLELPEEEGVHFLDALKLAVMNHHGIREGYTEGELKATKTHLKDLREILWNHLDISGEEGEGNDRAR